MNVSKKKEGRGVSGGGDGCGTPHTALTRVLRKLRAHIPLKTWAALSATGEVEAAILTYLAHTPPGNRATVAEYIETHYPAVLAQVYAQYVFGPKWWVSATLLALAPILYSYYQNSQRTPRYCVSSSPGYTGADRRGESEATPNPHTEPNPPHTTPTQPHNPRQTPQPNPTNPTQHGTPPQDNPYI